MAASEESLPTGPAPAPAAGAGADGGAGDAPLLKVEGLETVFFTPDGLLRAVDGLDLELRAGETLGVVGETGCGKTVGALSLTGIVPKPAGAVMGGRVLFKGEDLLQKSAAELRRIRSRDIAMIFQEPRGALNPVITVGEQIKEAILYRDDRLPGLHGWLRARGLRTPRVKALEEEAEAEAERWLRLTGIADPDLTLHRYPHELSAGVCQRVMIAMALAREPSLVIADEPTTALDVTIQAQILELMKDLKARTGAAVLLITHHMGLVAETCDRVAVMYAGRVVEVADTEALFRDPKHPYTRALLAALPDRARPGARLEAIPGSVPDMTDPPTGCRFHPRCPIAEAACARDSPGLDAAGAGHRVACHLAHRDTGGGAE